MWEGAYGKSFTIVAGDNVGDDGYITGGTTIATVIDQPLSDFPHTQTIRLDGDKKYRYVEFGGTITNAAEPTANDGFSNGDGTLTFVVGNIYAFKNTGSSTALDNVNASSVVTKVVYYNAAGMQASTPFSGFNIVASTHADSSTTVAKVPPRREVGTL